MSPHVTSSLSRPNKNKSPTSPCLTMAGSQMTTMTTTTLWPYYFNNLIYIQELSLCNTYVLLHKSWEEKWTSWSEMSVYGNGRAGITTGIATTPTDSPSTVFFTRSTTAHSVLSCTRPGNKISRVCWMIPYPPPTNITTTRSTRKPNYHWRQQWQIGWTRQQFLYSRIDFFHANLFSLTLSRMWRSTTSIFWMSSIHMQSLLPTWCTKCLTVQSVEASDFNHSGGYCYEFFFPLFHFLLTCICLKANMCFTHVYLAFISCSTCVHLEAYTFQLHI